MSTCNRRLVESLRGLALSLCAGLLFAAAAAFAQSPPPALFTRLQTRDAGDSAQNAVVEKIRARPSTGQVTLMRINPAALDAPSLTMDLGDVQASVTRSRAEPIGNGARAWHGSLPDVPGEATLIVRDGNITGTVRRDGEIYRIESVGGGTHAVVKVDVSRLPPEHPPSFIEKERQAVPPAPAPSSPRSDAGPAGDAPTGIDVLVAYTPSAAGAVTNIQDTIALAVAEANQSYINSQINLKLTLVDTMSMDAYSESGKSYDTILADMIGSQALKDRRNAKGADLVAVVINQADYCGLADAIQANANTAYAVVHYDCATGYYSFAHELGHLQGARHDPANDPSTTPFAYGHGFQYVSGSTKWRTIMAYACSGGCPRLQYWSNPNVNYGALAMGTAATNDNARVLNGTAATVAAFRNRPPANTQGWIWAYTGTPCSGNSCPGWQTYDNNAATARIAGGGSRLFQLHNSGRVWEYTGTPCSGASCPGWRMLDNNPSTVAIASDGTNLYQLHNTGRIWRYTGTPCSGNSCPGWQMLDNNPAALAIVADAGKLYQLHNTGRIWVHTGTPCSGNSCPGWKMLDNNPATVSITAGGGKLYQLHDSGRIWRHTGVACSGNSCPGWQMIDNNPAAAAIVAGTQLYQLHNTGRVWRHTGVACSGNSCPGWQMLDNNPATIALYADAGALYQLHNTGRAWRSTGAVCSGNSCPGWQMLDNNGSTGRLAAAGGKLYQLHTARTPMTRARVCYDCR
jgi:hypothetical protein